MKKIRETFLFYILMSFLYSCGAASEAGKVLRNEKTKTTDEFLVKKREPLTLPPDYKNLPEPGSIGISKKNKNNSIDKILNIPEENIAKKNKSSSVEQSIINEIGK